MSSAAPNSCDPDVPLSHTRIIRTTTQSSPDDLDDIPADPGSYDYFSVVKQYDDAWTRIKTPKAAVPADGEQRPSSQQPDRGITRSESVLEEANKRYKPGDPVSPMILAEHLGLSRQTVSSAIKYLRKRGKWPFQRYPMGWIYRRSANGCDGEATE